MTCNDCNGCDGQINNRNSKDIEENPGYVFGSAIITITIGALAFITALAWNSFVQQTFETYETRSEELKAKLSYAFLVTAIAIVFGFLVMYFIGGNKW